MKKFLLLISVFITTNTIQADVAHGVLEKHRNRIFVCVGIGSCINFARALNANFTELYGLDDDIVLVNHAPLVMPRFIKDAPRPNFKRYHVYHGNPTTALENLIKPINEPITFLLGNYIPDPDQPDKFNSLLDELEQIKKHPLKTHTILIDYVHHTKTLNSGNILLSDIKKKLLEINSDYLFAFEKGGHLEKEEGAILVGYLS